MPAQALLPVQSSSRAPAFCGFVRPKTLLLSSNAGAPVLRGLKRKRRLPPERLRRSAVHLHPPHRRPRLLHPTILCKIDPNPTILDPFGNRGFGLPGPMPVLLVRSCAAGDQVRKRHPRVRSLLQLPRHPGFFSPWRFHVCSQSVIDLLGCIRS